MMMRATRASETTTSSIAMVRRISYRSLPRCINNTIETHWDSLYGDTER